MLEFFDASLTGVAFTLQFAAQTHDRALLPRACHNGDDTTPQAACKHPRRTPLFPRRQRRATRATQQKLKEEKRSNGEEGRKSSLVAPVPG